MADVLVTHSYVLRLDPKQWRERRPYPPLGTLLAAAVVRETGRSVAFHDVMHAASIDAFIDALDRERPRTVVIYDDGFNYLTKMCLTNMRAEAFAMLAAARAKGIRTVMSSSDANDHTEDYLRAGADVVLLGEAEATLLDVLDAMDADASFDDIPGTAVLRDDHVHRAAKRPVMTTLDALPLPAWDMLDIAPYRAMWEASTGALSLNIATTRGCPFKCNWCAKPIYGNRYTSRSPEHVADELALLHRLFAPQHIWFCDDIFGLKPGWVQRFADVVESRGLRTPFTIQSRADLLVKDDTVAALARAGCAKVWLGAESGSQRILDAMDKGITVEEIHRSVGMLRSHGIIPALFLQFGYLGETRRDIDATLDMVRTLLPDDIGVSVSYPLPGTGFYETVRTSLGAKSNWSDSDDLALMFSNTYRPAFYRRLHRYVHHDLRARQGGLKAPLHALAALVERLRMRLEERPA